MINPMEKEIVSMKLKNMSKKKDIKKKSKKGGNFFDNG
jgi:hypothetical protein